MIPLRLGKYLSAACGWSRRAIGREHVAGRITVNGASLGLSALVYAEDKVRVDGVIVRAKEPEHHVLLSKPAGVVSTLSDPGGRPCLAPWVERAGAGAHPVGRLDRATTGLLFLTDDGDLAHIMLRAEYHVTKEYHLRLEGGRGRTEAGLARMREGVDIGDERVARALEAFVCGGTRDATFARVILEEGRNRQVRRMCRAAGLWLEHLHRARIGPMRHGALASGEMRRLAPEELDALWGAVGGQGAMWERKRAALVRRTHVMRELGTPDARLEAWLEESDVGV